MSLAKIREGLKEPITTPKEEQSPFDRDKIGETILSETQRRILYPPYSITRNVPFEKDEPKA